MMYFDKKAAISHDDWLRSPAGSYAHRRNSQLILDLLAPKESERLLDIGCKTGACLHLFRREGCDITGLDSSPDMLNAARKRLGQRTELYAGDYEDLPFSDNEFDIVTMTASLEFSENPEEAISEAIRVCRGRMFLGTLNKYSVASTRGMGEKTLLPSIYKNGRSFSVFELIQIVKGFLPDTVIRWGSVVFFPLSCYPFADFLEENIPVMKNPFGCFAGLAFPIVFTHTTIQHPIEKTIMNAVRPEQQGSR